MSENLAGKWFCDTGLEQDSPDHSYFGDFRARIGTEGLMDLFARVRSSLVSMGLIREVFTFVDASQLVSKLTTWDERDKAIKMGLEKFNNETASRVRYKSLAKVQFQVAVRALYFNLKRLMVLEVGRVELV